MVDHRIQLPASEALRNPRVRRSLMWGLIVAALVGLLAAAPPTRTEPVPWTGWVGA